jgi:hypothetical protein
MWAIALILSVPFWIFSVYDSAFNPGDPGKNSSSLITVCHVNASSSADRAYITSFIIILIFIPFFILFYIYTRIVIELARHRAVRLTSIPRLQHSTYEDEPSVVSTHQEQQSHSFLAYRRVEHKRLNTVVICVVTVAFFACQFPVRIIQLVNMYGRVRNEATMPHLAWIWIWKLSKLLFFLNFTANPVKYY